jgi:hypothetical protein
MNAGIRTIDLIIAARAPHGTGRFFKEEHQAITESSEKMARMVGMGKT